MNVETGRAAQLINRTPRGSRAAAQREGVRQLPGHRGRRSGDAFLGGSAPLVSALGAHPLSAGIRADLDARSVEAADVAADPRPDTAEQMSFRAPPCQGWIRRRRQPSMECGL